MTAARTARPVRPFPTFHDGNVPRVIPNTTAAVAFAPHEALASRLLPVLPDVGDGSHDLAHLLRVWSNVRAIRAKEGGDGEVLAAACLLHDCVAVEKGSPLRSQASRLAAERAAQVLAGLGWAPDRIGAVVHAIEAHSFSAGIPPESLEARILQDADRLDAIGALGIAWCFYTAGRMGSALYQAEDPHAEHRGHDDARYALDHFHAKLLHLASGFRTGAGRAMAAVRHRRMELFVSDLSEEIGAKPRAGGRLDPELAQAG